MPSRTRLAAFGVAAFAAGLVAGHATGQSPRRMGVDTVLDVVTDELPRRARVRANVNRWDPGSETGRHTHPGPTVFVMLDGELEEILPDGTRRTLATGQGFWKPARTDHNVRNVSMHPARALAIHLDPVR